MNFKRLFTGAIAAVAAFGMAYADTMDASGYPQIYLRGSMTEGWSAREDFRFTREGEVYTLHLASLDGDFKIAGDEWDFDYGSQNSKQDPALEITDATTLTARYTGGNFKAVGLTDVTLSITIRPDAPKADTYLRISANGKEAPAEPQNPMLSGTLPVLYINVYTDESHSALEPEIIDRNLSHKNYFSNAEYWLDHNGCEWLEAEGAASVGSKEEPLPLEIKARGNYTRKAFAKKPFKLKLGAKQSLLGLSKSKHFALLAHADDNYGYMRNFTGFRLGRAIGLPWTPWQQPVEVIINGDYRGLYFLTESIRVDKKRVNIEELDDLVDTPALVSGGYIVELDNYEEENQIRMPELSCARGQHIIDELRITWDTPEEYSELQKRFITDQFSAMNSAIGSNSDEVWSYMDLDDAARYYIVEEIISHHEAYHGSTYLFRDRGEGQKWHFSPLWDCGNAFNGRTTDFFYNCDHYGNTWIPSMRENATFNKKVRETWLWFMNTGYKALEPELTAYASHIAAAAKADRTRWQNARRPDFEGAQGVVDNTDMERRLQAVRDHLSAKTEWLKGQFGDYAANPGATEPERDATPAAALPEYAREDSGIEGPAVEGDAAPASVKLYNLQGMPVSGTPVRGEIYIEVRGDQARAVRF
ncbi:MAG: CotH kinase family protein [Muribaculaceae bacterium]|nr:CotH kinase family protein [Muribaculaceae bacterium]